MTVSQAAHARRTCIERLVAVFTIVNAGLGLAIALYSGHVPVLLALLGLLAGALAWRGWKGGHLAALAFYGPQLASYYAFDLSQAYNGRGALSLAVVTHLPSGVLVVNVLAVAMFAASAALLWWPSSGSKCVQSTYQ